MSVERKLCSQRDAMRSVIDTESPVSVTIVNLDI